MARIPYADPQKASEEVRKTLDELPVKLNIFRLMAHAETCFRPLLRLGSVILSQQKLDASLRELAILQVAKLSPAEYEWVQHVAIAEAVGVTPQQIQALDEGDVDADSFSDRERLLLEFTTELVRDVRVCDDTFGEMEKSFSPQEIVELILAIGFYMTMARLMETLDIDLEPAASTKVLEAARTTRASS